MGDDRTTLAEPVLLHPSAAARPLPPTAVSVRPATPADLPFIDALQKRHAKAVGWMPTQQLAGKVAKGEVLVAEATGKDEGGKVAEWATARDRMKDESSADAGGADSPVPASPSSFIRSRAVAHSATFPPSSFPHLGYLISSDRYLKHDDVGIIYQMNVVPAAQRSLVGATLLKAAFDRAAYGCKLFCCWCAQDLEANRFWEAMGFVPLAFRAGSAKKSRVHIFWQRRVRAGDVTTPWWYPSQTSSGAIREDRLVLPIPPGTHWADAKPIVLPAAVLPAGELTGEAPPAIDDKPAARDRKKRGSASAERVRGAAAPPPSRVLGG